MASSLLGGKQRLALVNTLVKQDKLVFNLHRLLYRAASTTTQKKNAISFADNAGKAFPLGVTSKENDFSFEDGKRAFVAKSNYELLRGYLVFQLCGIKFLLDNQKMVTH